MSSDEPWTVLRLLEWTTEFFKKRGSDSARLDAEVLLAHARGCERIDLYTAFAEEPEEEQRVAFREMVRRRGEGVPVAQLVGYKEFFSLRFRVDENVLVPRPETEYLVNEALDAARSIQSCHEIDRALRLVDVGTGSGAIAVTLAKQLVQAEVTAIDISAAAIGIAKWNAEQLGVIDRITFVISDLFRDLAKNIRFDVICSNPPYITEDEFEDLPITIRDHEPTSALVSGPKGTEIISRLIEACDERLSEGGQLIVELSPMIASECMKLAHACGTFSKVRLIKDLAGHDRVLSAQKIV